MLPIHSITKTRTQSGLLVDLKYVTSKQKFSLEYEGNTIFFEVDAILPQSHDKDTSRDLLSQLEGLKIDHVPQIWIVGWDTNVVILLADTLKPSGSVKVRTTFPPGTPLTLAKPEPADRHKPVRCSRWPG